MIIEKDARDNVVSSSYASYKASEIKSIDGKPFVKCDEYQHQQNRRTTVRFAFEDKKSRVQVNVDVDANNTNDGKATRDSLAGKSDSAQAPQNVNPVSDEDMMYAVKLNIKREDDKKSIPLMVMGKEPAMFEIDDKKRYDVVPPEVAAEWYTKKLITKKDFVSGDKFKVGKVKLRGNRFIVQELHFGRYVAKGVQFKIDERAKAPTIGSRTMKKFFKSSSYETDTELILIPKRIPREWRVKKKKKK